MGYNIYDTTNVYSGSAVTNDKTPSAHVTFENIDNALNLTHLTGVITDTNSKELIKVVSGISISNGDTNTINLEGTNAHDGQNLTLTIVKYTKSLANNVDFIITAFADCVVSAPQKEFFSWVEQNRRIEFGELQLAVGDAMKIRYAICSRETTKEGNTSVVIGHTNDTTHPGRIQFTDILTEYPKLQMTDDVDTQELDGRGFFEFGKMMDFEFVIGPGNVHTFLIDGYEVGEITFAPLLVDTLVNVNRENNCFFQFFEISRGGEVVYQSDTSYIPATKFANINNNINTLGLLQNYIRGMTEFNVEMVRSGDYWIRNSALDYFKILHQSIRPGPTDFPLGEFTLVPSTGQSLSIGLALGDEYQWPQGTPVTNCWVVDENGDIKRLFPEQYCAAYSMIEEYAKKTDRNFLFIQAGVDGKDLDDLRSDAFWLPFVAELTAMGAAMNGRTISEVIIPHIHLESDALKNKQDVYEANVKTYFNDIFAEIDTHFNTGYDRRIIISPMGFSITSFGTDASILQRFNMNNVAQELHFPPLGYYTGAPRGHHNIYPTQAHEDTVHFAPIGYDKLGRDLAQVLIDIDDNGGAEPFRMASASFTGDTVTVSFENFIAPILTRLDNYTESLGFMFQRADDTFYKPSSAILNPDNTVTLVSDEALSTSMKVCYYDYLSHEEGAPKAPLMDSTGYQCLKTADIINKHLCPTSIALAAE